MKRKDLSIKMEQKDYESFVQSIDKNDLNNFFSKYKKNYEELSLPDSNILGLALNYAIRSNDQPAVTKILSLSSNDYTEVLTTTDASRRSPLINTLYFHNADNDIWKTLDAYLSNLSSNRSQKIELSGRDFLNMRSVVMLPLFDHMTIYSKLDYLRDHFLSHIYNESSIDQLNKTFGKNIYFDANSYLKSCENQKSDGSLVLE